MDGWRVTFRSVLRKLRDAGVVIVLAACFFALLAAFIFSIHRFALSDPRLYSYFFAAVIAGIVLYFALKRAREKRLAVILVKLARFFLVLISILSIFAAFLLAAALIIRDPIIGSASTLIFIFCLFFIQVKLHAFSRLKNIFHKFQSGY